VRVALDDTAARLPDQVEGAPEGELGDPAPAVRLVDEDAAPELKKSRTNRFGRNLASMPGVEIRPLSTLSHETAPHFASSKRRLLAIKGHGRNYCTSKGLLCGARRIDELPEQRVNHCVANFSCAGPEFLRLDPRRLNSRLLVLHACDTISLETDFWRWGNAAVGFLATAGYASAVIAGDGESRAAKDDHHVRGSMHA